MLHQKSSEASLLFSHKINPRWPPSSPLWCVMVENTNSTTLEVQGSFALTYMVRFIPLNLRSQEMGKGVPHARARAAAAAAGPGVAWRGVARRGEAGRRAGVVWLC
jgi:hypothetical protein